MYYDWKKAISRKYWDKNRKPWKNIVKLIKNATGQINGFSAETHLVVVVVVIVVVVTVVVVAAAATAVVVLIINS